MMQGELQRTSELSSPRARTDVTGLRLGLDHDQESLNRGKSSVPCPGEHQKEQS